MSIRSKVKIHAANLSLMITLRKIFNSVNCKSLYSAALILQTLQCKLEFESIVSKNCFIILSILKISNLHWNSIKNCTWVDKSSDKHPKRHSTKFISLLTSSATSISWPKDSARLRDSSATKVHSSLNILASFGNKSSWIPAQSRKNRPLSVV